MIIYHGGPITPDTVAARVWTARHAFISFEHPGQLGLACEIAAGVALDNGAFSYWRRGGHERANWDDFYAWAATALRQPAVQWAVIPDTITGSEVRNDELLKEWPFAPALGVPVWHLHESIARLVRLCSEWPRVALGSSGQWQHPGTPQWWHRMGEAMQAITDGQGLPAAKLHGLRMLNPEVFTRLPLSSADSTSVARNIGLDVQWKGTYTPPTKECRAMVLCERLEAHNAARAWHGPPVQTRLFEDTG